MSILSDIKAVCTAANPDYDVHYEEAYMMNVTADEIPIDKGFVYIEEFVTGKYEKEKFFRNKHVNMQVYFCKFIAHGSTAEQREAVRETIESEILEGFMLEYNNSKKFEYVDTFNFVASLPRFDANEVSILLQFECTKARC